MFFTLPRIAIVTNHISASNEYNEFNLCSFVQTVSGTLFLIIIGAIVIAIRCSIWISIIPYPKVASGTPFEVASNTPSDLLSVRPSDAPSAMTFASSTTKTDVNLWFQWACSNDWAWAHQAMGHFPSSVIVSFVFWHRQFNDDMSLWEASSVVSMSDAFFYTAFFNLRKWSDGQVTGMSCVLHSTTSFGQKIC